MDDLDRQLIGLLRQNARAPVTALAKALKLSRGAVQNRIDRMLAKGELGGFTIRAAELRPSTAIMARARTREASAGSAAVVKALSGLPEVAAIHSTNGRWDLVAELDAESLEAFSRTLDALRLIDGVAASETSLLLATHRH